MVKSFTPQTEMNQTDTQRLMFSWKKTEFENIFGINTKPIHVRALSDWMKILILTVPSETNMHTLFENQGDPHLTPLSPKHHRERQKIYKDDSDNVSALKKLKNKK